MLIDDEFAQQMRADSEQKAMSTCGRCACASLVAQIQGPSKSVANNNKRTLEMDPRTTVPTNIEVYFWGTKN